MGEPDEPVEATPGSRWSKRDAELTDAWAMLFESLIRLDAVGVPIEDVRLVLQLPPETSSKPERKA